jgi:hypothetical protein
MCAAFVFQEGPFFSAAQFRNKLEPPDQFVMGVSDTNTCCQKTGDEVLYVLAAKAACQRTRRSDAALETAVRIT